MTPSAPPVDGDQAHVARPAGPSRSVRPGPWRARIQAGPDPRLHVDRRQPAGGPGARRPASRWSRRSPPPLTTTSRPAPRSRAASMAELGVDGVLGRRVALDGRRRRRRRRPSAPGVTESRSPTTRSTARPRARAWSSPESAAMTKRSPGEVRSTTPGWGGAPPRTTTNCGSTSPSAGITQIRFEGRWRIGHPLSPASSELPVVLVVRGYVGLGARLVHVRLDVHDVGRRHHRAHARLDVVDGLGQRRHRQGRGRTRAWPRRGARRARGARCGGG